MWFIKKISSYTSNLNCIKKSLVLNNVPINQVSLHYFCERPISSVTFDKEFPAEISFEKVKMHNAFIMNLPKINEKVRHKKKKKSMDLPNNSQQALGT